jgi:hypothetical protein
MMVGKMVKKALIAVAVVVGVCTQSHSQEFVRRAVVAESAGSSPYLIKVGGAEVDVDVDGQPAALTDDELLSWIRKACEAVTGYYGRFPVRRIRVTITGSSAEDHSIHGTTWGDVAGFQGVSRMRLGRDVSSNDLDSDWTMTHELVHLAISSLPESEHWLEEGLATYVEPLARAQAGQLTESQAWEGMLHGMQQGEPRPGDQGLNKTHTWGRTYWGGALFCLEADVSIRQATANHKGLQDALRAIVASGATIDTERPIEDVLRVGDHATGTTALETTYNEWKSRPVTVDLAPLWMELGVKSGTHGVVLTQDAPLAQMRRAIVTRPK